MTIILDPIANSPGWFKMQKVRGGAYLPAIMWVVECLDPETEEKTGDDMFFAEIAGERIDAFNPPNWPYGWQRIDEAEWRYLTDQLEWARRNQPHGPLANADLPARLTQREIF